MAQNALTSILRSNVISTKLILSFSNGGSLGVLKESPEGHIVIMDNASFHRKSKLHEFAGKVKVGLIFLPPYSPDFNPIEKSWANMKRWLRSNMLN